MDSYDHLGRAVTLMEAMYAEADDPDPRLTDAAAHLQCAGVQNVLDDEAVALADDDTPVGEVETGNATEGADEAEPASTDGGTQSETETVIEPARDFDYDRLEVETRDRPDGLTWSEVTDNDRTRKEYVNPDTTAHHVLGIIVDRGKPMTTKELKETTELAAGTISSALSKLHKYTYLDREKTDNYPDSDGRPKNVYYPTEWGREQLRALDAATDEEADDA